MIFEFLVRDGLDKMGGVTREAEFKMTNKRKVTISCNGKKKKRLNKFTIIKIKKVNNQGISFDGLEFGHVHRIPEIDFLWQVKGLHEQGT